MHLFLQYFGIPSGAVWSNVAAEPIIAVLTGIVVFLARKPLSRKMAAWRASHHQHIKDHITSETDRLREELNKLREELKNGDQA